MAHYNVRLEKLPKRFYVLRPDDDNWEKESEDGIDTDSSQDVSADDLTKKKTKPVPTFYDEFTISNIKKPISISLKNVRTEEELPINEIQNEIQDAYNKGFSDGQEVAKTNLEADIQKYTNWIKNFDTISSELKNIFDSELIKFQESVVSVAVIIAENIINNEIVENKNLIIKNIEEIFKNLKDEVIFKIKLHPDNVDILKDVKSSLISKQNGSKDIDVVPDSSVDKFGCILETSAGVIDTRIKTQLEIIAKRLEQEVLESVD